MKYFYFLFIIILLIISCKKESHENKIKIISTIFPLYEFSKEIGGDKVDVSIILPPGTESHSFEPTPKDVVLINESDIFLYIGESMEPWAQVIFKSIKGQKLHILEAGKDIEMIKSDNNDHGQYDPHIWLDFTIDEKIVDKISILLSEIDPENKVFYNMNAEIYKNKLITLDKKYKDTLDRCQLKTIMFGGHFAFGYLSRRYGLNHISPYEGFSAEAEPTPGKISELIDNIKKNGIEYLYYEELLEPKVSKVIARETGVKLELLHAAHNLTKEEFANNLSFFEIMDSNLEMLKKGLKYK